MNLYKDKFNGPNFYFDDNPENLEALQNAKCLITSIEAAEQRTTIEKELHLEE